MSSVTLVRRIAASADTVFVLISTPEGITQWWGPDGGPVLIAEFDARVGGRFRVRFRMRNGSEHECSGEVREIVRPLRLVTTWCWEENEGEAVSQIEISLKAADDGCELVFTHALLPDPATAKGHEKGWNGSLDKLERLLQMASDDRAIREVHTTWIAAVNDGDLVRLLSLMADDVVFLNPGKAPFGRDGFPAGFSAAHQQNRIRCISELEEVVVAGVVAYTLCRDSLTVTPRVTPHAGGEATKLAGHRITIYRKQPDGRWLLARDAHTLSPVASV